MARNVTLLDLRTRVRQRADAENDPHVTDTEIDGLINNANTAFYDDLISSAPPDYFRTSYTFSTANGTVAYALPADFYKLRQLYVIDQTGIFRPLEQVDEVARHSYRAPNSVCSMRLDYIPVPTGLVNNTDEMDGINGWDEFIVLTAAIDIKNKKEDDASALIRKRNEVQERMRKMAPRDEGAPRHVIRRNYYGQSRRAWYVESAVQAQVHGYTLVGSNIEVYRFAGHIAL